MPALFFKNINTMQDWWTSPAEAPDGQMVMVPLSDELMAAHA